MKVASFSAGAEGMEYVEEKSEEKLEKCHTQIKVEGGSSTASTTEPLVAKVQATGTGVASVAEDPLPPPVPATASMPKLQEVRVKLGFNSPLRPAASTSSSSSSSTSTGAGAVTAPLATSCNLAGRVTSPPSLSRGERSNAGPASAAGTAGPGGGGGGSGEDLSHLVHIVNVQVDERSRPIRSCRQGIFDRATPSNTEMDWSSDESSSIQSAREPPGNDDNNNGSTSAEGEKDKSTLKPAKASPSNFKFPLRKGAWSEEESRCLLEGVEKFGEGKWKEIRAQAYSVLRFRTTSQLKDKYRNIKGRPK